MILAGIADSEGHPLPGLFVKTVSRGQGHSVVRQAAYCGRRRLYDQRLGRSFDFTRRAGLVFSEFRLPPGDFPPWRDPERFWNALEARLTRVNARLAREILLALPRARALSDSVDLVRGFLEAEFVCHGHAVDWHIHADRPRNPHVHALVSFPVVSGADFLPPGPAWDRRAWLVGLHAAWRRHCTRAGLTVTPSQPYGLHLGPAHALARRGVITRQGQRLAALKALARRPPGQRLAAWARVRIRRRERALDARMRGR